MPSLENKLIVALDVFTLEEARRLVDLLYPEVKLFKIGSQLFTACGPEAVKIIGEKGARVFLDLKFHDIPNTVASATSSGTSLPVFMMTVHTKGGKAMLEAAVRGAMEKSDELKIDRPLIVGVTRLTSDDNQEDTSKVVLEAARLAKDSGLDGVVCAASEAGLIRNEFGKKFIIVTPGIRPKGAASDDQKRTATAQEAIAAGSDYLVIGRPILKAQDPLRAVKELI